MIDQVKCSKRTDCTCASRKVHAFAIANSLQIEIFSFQSKDHNIIMPTALIDVK